MTTILRNNPDRLAYILVNLGLYDIYVGFSEDTSTSKGIFVGKQGGSLTLDVREDYELVGYQLFGIADGGTSSIYAVTVEAE